MPREDLERARLGAASFEVRCSVSDCAWLRKKESARGGKKGNGNELVVVVTSALAETADCEGNS